MSAIKLPANMFARQYVTKKGIVRQRFYCRYTLNGKREIEPLGSYLQKAREKYHEIMRAVEHGEDPKAKKKRTEGATFALWGQRWLAVTQQKASHGKDIVSVQRLTAFFGNLPLEQLTTERIESYKAYRRAEKTRHGRLVSPALVNRELSALRSVLVLAKESGAMPARPPIRAYREHNERDRIISIGEYHQLHEAMKDRYKPVLVILWELGAREGEVIGLAWSRVHFERKALTFSKTKTDPRTVPMSPAVEAVLRSIPRQDGDDRVFPFTVDTFKSSFGRVRKKLGLSGLWVHDFRRTFVTRKLLEGYDYKRIMMITGHKSLKIFSRYSKPSFEDLRGVLDTGNVLAKKLPDQSNESTKEEKKQ